MCFVVRGHSGSVVEADCEWFSGGDAMMGGHVVWFDVVPVGSRIDNCKLSGGGGTYFRNIIFV